MIIMNNEKRSYRLALGGAVGKSLVSPPLHLVHANDQDGGDDFEGQRNWTFMLVLFAAAAAGISSSVAIWSLL